MYTTNSESALSDADELVFAEYWNNLSVDKEVLRGVELRKEKPKHLGKPECSIIDVNFDIHSASTKKSCSYKGKRIKPEPSQMSSLFSSCNSLSSSLLNPCYNSYKRRNKHSRPKNNIKRNKLRNKCPMRIAELSEPTKRYCLDTWRYKGKDLPDFMTDRLRQRVMDQKPLVHIDDAIICFKAKKNKKSRKQSHIKSGTKNKNQNKDKKKLLCALFGYKITRKLLQPARIVLNPDLQKLCDIINYEFTTLLSTTKNKPCGKNQRVQNEIAGMVTIWTASILEEATMKLIIDDFEELKEKEGHIWDLIDYIVDLVVDQCKSETISDFETSDSNDNNKSESYISLETNTSSNSSDISEHITLEEKQSHFLVKISSQDGLNLNEVGINEIVDAKSSAEVIALMVSEIVDEMFSELKIKFTETVPSLEDFVTSILVTKLNEVIIDPSDNIDVFIVNGTDTENQLLNNTNKDKMLILQNVNSAEQTEHQNHITTEETIPDELSTNINNDELIENIEREEQKNRESAEENFNEDVSSKPDKVFSDSEIKTDVDLIQANESESPDDSFKKVKFSNSFEIDSRPIEAFNQITTNSLSSLSSLSKRINFSPPNTHLISNADETWPENILPLTPKVSAGVKKSVTSLGYITESEEVFSASSETQHHLKREKILERNITGSTDSTLPNNNDSDKTEQIKNHLFDNFKFNDQAEDNLNTIRIDEIDEKMSENSKLINSVNLIKFKSPGIHNDSKILSNLDFKTLPPIEIASKITKKIPMRHFKDEKETQTKAKREVQEKNGVIPKRLALLQQHEIRIWCKGLENVISNLETWLQWIETTHACVADLRKKNVSVFSRKMKRENLIRWIKLKENIDFDAKMWHRIHKKLVTGLNSYKNYYVMGKTIQSSHLQGSCLCNKAF